MGIIDDFLYINKNVFKKTWNSFKNHWVIIFTGIVYITLSFFIFNLLNIVLRGPFSIFSGILLAVVSSSLISNYLYLLFNIINYDRLNFQHFKDGFSHFLWKIYGVFFIGFLANFLLSFVLRMVGSSAMALNLIITVIVMILLNPLPETIYLKSYSAQDSIKYSVNFIQENWMNWMIPNIVFSILIYVITGKVLSGLFNTYTPIGSIFDFKGIVMYLLGQSVFSFMMIYRGHLYKMLSGSTRRKREYMRKNLIKGD